MTEQEKEASYEEAFRLLGRVKLLLEQCRLKQEKVMQSETVK